LIDDDGGEEMRTMNKSDGEKIGYDEDRREIILRGLGVRLLGFFGVSVLEEKR